MGTVLVVTSGKGGAGKSTVSAGLGCALARLGKKVLLVDADAGLRSLDLMLGVAGTTVYDSSDVFSGHCNAMRAIYPSPVRPGVFVLSAPVDLDGRATPEQMRSLCQELAEHFDHVIVDCPAGIGLGFRIATHAADRALVVTTPDMVCARDAQIVSRLLEDAGTPAHLIINRLRSNPIQKGRMPDVDEIIDVSGLQLLGILPEDEAVAVANANGEPLPSDSNATVCFENIAQRYLGNVVPLAALKKM